MSRVKFDPIENNKNDLVISWAQNAIRKFLSKFSEDKTQTFIIATSNRYHREFKENDNSPFIGILLVADFALTDVKIMPTALANLKLSNDGYLVSCDMSPAVSGNFVYLYLKINSEEDTVSFTCIED